MSLCLDGRPCPTVKGRLGYAMNLQAALKDRGDYRVVMLPEVA